MNKLVSIITPSFNSARFIEECILSVISQTYKNWEMLIVDDCSQDNSVDIISKFSNNETRIRLFRLEKNVGPAEARNIAIRNASGKYIAFLDSDDMWCSNKLEDQLKFMKKNNVEFSFTTYQCVYENGNDMNKIIKAPNKMTYHSYLKNTIIGCLTVIIDKEKTGYFEMPNIKSSQDMALWLYFMKKGISAYGLDINLAKYRIVSSSNTSNKLNAVKDVWKVYREIEKLSVLYSIWCWINYAYNAIIKRL